MSSLPNPHSYCQASVDPFHLKRPVRVAEGAVPELVEIPFGFRCPPGPFRTDSPGSSARRTVGSRVAARWGCADRHRVPARAVGRLGCRELSSEAGVWAPPASGGRAAGSCAVSLPVRDLQGQPRCRERGGLPDWARTATVVPVLWVSARAGSLTSAAGQRAVSQAWAPLRRSKDCALSRMSWRPSQPNRLVHVSRGSSGLLRARGLLKAQAWSQQPGVPAAPGR